MLCSVSYKLLMKIYRHEGDVYTKLSFAFHRRA